jgi:metallopeptidase MepB
MMFENFFWTPQHMKALSYHYSKLSPAYAEAWRAARRREELRSEDHMPPVQLDDEVLNKVIRHKDNESVLSILFLIHQSVFDMTIHGPATHADLEAMDLRETFDSLRRKITGVSGWESLGPEQDTSNGHTAFRAIVTRYDAGYYTYLL